MAGAVMAGCLVASVKCNSCISTKLAAYTTPDQKPVQNADKPTAITANFSAVVPAVSAPPPAAWPSMARYSRALRVM